MGAVSCRNREHSVKNEFASRVGKQFSLKGASNNLMGLLAVVGHDLTGLDSWNTLAELPLRFAAREDFVFTLFGRTS